MPAWKPSADVCKGRMQNQTLPCTSNPAHQAPLSIAFHQASLGHQTLHKTCDGDDALQSHTRIWPIIADGTHLDICKPPSLRQAVQSLPVAGSLYVNNHAPVTRKAWSTMVSYGQDDVNCACARRIDSVSLYREPSLGLIEVLNLKLHA